MGLKSVARRIFRSEEWGWVVLKEVGMLIFARAQIVDSFWLSIGKISGTFLYSCARHMLAQLPLRWVESPRRAAGFSSAT